MHFCISVWFACFQVQMVTNLSLWSTKDGKTGQSASSVSETQHLSFSGCLAMELSDKVLGWRNPFLENKEFEEVKNYGFEVTK